MSVVIPCYNYGRFLNDAIASVRAQTLQDFEIIVVDDGSNDDVTPGVLDVLEGPDQQPGLTIIRQVNQGAPAARNTGIGRQKGFMSAAWTPTTPWSRHTWKNASC